MWSWLLRDWHWPAASLFASVFLLALTPLFVELGGLPLALVYLQLPIYMLHQGEEHLGDRFRLYINGALGGGRELLTPTTTFWINSAGVWAVDLAALYLAWAVNVSAGLTAAYLTVVNGVSHIGMAIARREYNPGLVSAALLFLPAGGWCLLEVGSQSSLQAHAAGIVAAVAIHVCIIVILVRRLKGLPQAKPLEASGDADG